MKVRERDEPVMLKEIPEGECFKDCGKYWIKTDETLTDMQNSITKCRVVNMETGYLSQVREDRLVEPIEIEVVIR